MCCILAQQQLTTCGSRPHARGSARDVAAHHFCWDRVHKFVVCAHTFVHALQWCAFGARFVALLFDHRHRGLFGPHSAVSITMVPFLL